MKNTYTAQHIQILKDLEHVRKRPGMYIGTTGTEGLHHLVYEVVDNSIDEAVVGHCSNILVVIEKGDIIRVEDDGRGIPVDIHPTEKVSALEIVMTKLNAGGKSYKVSGGLHGVGVSVVNALSEWCEVWVNRDGKKYYQRYKRGIPEKKVAITGKAESTATGTVTRFLADNKVFTNILYSFDILSHRLRELAFLNKGIQISIIDERSDKARSHVFKFEGGVKSFIQYLNKNKNPIHKEPIHFENTREDINVEIALEYNDSYSETIFTFANCIY